MPHGPSSPQVPYLFPPSQPQSLDSSCASVPFLFCTGSHIPGPLLGPCHTCHLQIQHLILVIMFHITSSLHSEEVVSCVATPGVSDAQRIVVGHGVPEDVESAQGLHRYCSMWVVRGHKIVEACVVPISVPVHVDFSRGDSTNSGIGKGAGHEDAQTPPALSLIYALEA